MFEEGEVQFVLRETLNSAGLDECQRWRPFQGQGGAFRVGQSIPTTHGVGVGLETEAAGWKEAGLPDRACCGCCLSPTLSYPLIQFVCVESLVTALVDMYPRVFRKKNRREILILIVSVISFFIGLIMLTEVRVWEQSGDQIRSQTDNGTCWEGPQHRPKDLGGTRTLSLVPRD